MCACLWITQLLLLLLLLSSTPCSPLIHFIVSLYVWSNLWPTTALCVRVCWITQRKGKKAKMMMIATKQQGKKCRRFHQPQLWPFLACFLPGLNKKERKKERTPQCSATLKRCLSSRFQQQQEQCNHSMISGTTSLISFSVFSFSSRPLVRKDSACVLHQD